ncbi:MAG: hypothetical protein PHN56_05420 [Candidatus Nanoarchaeia archaeon]|nr:hypothetical protein [Candidatus Nanoarchaeia archaeon]
MNKLLLPLFALILIAGCTQSSQITNFEECVAAGNPVMESYPRQCMANGVNFAEEIEMCGAMSIDQALITVQTSDCANEGILSGVYVCNNITNTLWMDLTIEDLEGCNPACVVDVLTGEVEINYRCTGLIIE